MKILFLRAANVHGCIMFIIINIYIYPKYVSDSSYKPDKKSHPYYCIKRTYYFSYRQYTFFFFLQNNVELYITGQKFGIHLKKVFYGHQYCIYFIYTKIKN